MHAHLTVAVTCMGHHQWRQSSSSSSSSSSFSSVPPTPYVTITYRADVYSLRTAENFSFEITFKTLIGGRECPVEKQLEHSMLPDQRTRITVHRSADESLASRGIGCLQNEKRRPMSTRHVLVDFEDRCADEVHLRFDDVATMVEKCAFGTTSSCRYLQHCHHLHLGTWRHTTMASLWCRSCVCLISGVRGIAVTHTWRTSALYINMPSTSADRRVVTITAWPSRAPVNHPYRSPIERPPTRRDHAPNDPGR